MEQVLRSVSGAQREVGTTARDIYIFDLRGYHPSIFYIIGMSRDQEERVQVHYHYHYYPNEGEERA